MKNLILQDKPVDMPANPEQLTCISLIVCDDVYRDIRTKKMVIVGTFNAINPSTLPTEYHGFRVLMTLTNARGRYNLKLSIEHEQSGDPVIEIDGPFEFNDPLGVIDIDAEIRPFPIPRAGKYWVKVESDGRILQQRPIFVRTPQSKEDPQ